MPNSFNRQRHFLKVSYNEETHDLDDSSHFLHNTHQTGDIQKSTLLNSRTHLSLNEKAIWSRKEDDTSTSTL